MTFWCVMCSFETDDEDEAYAHDCMKPRDKTRECHVSELELPWCVKDLSDDWLAGIMFPWGVANKWGEIIGRFDTEDQARTVVDAVNQLLNVPRQ